MRHARNVLPLLALPLAALLGVIAASAAPAAGDAEAGATALVAQVLLPGQPPAASGFLSAPPTAAGGGPFSYPDDGSVLRVGASTASATAQPGVSSSGQASVNALAVSVFGGEIAAESIDIRTGAAAGPAGATGDVSAASITGLVVLGQAVTPSANVQLPLADWGTVDLLATTSTSTQVAPRSAESTATGLRIRLIAEHGGLPAGSEIVVAATTAKAAAQTVAATTTETTPVPARPVTKPVQIPRPVRPLGPQEPGRSIPGAPAELVRPAPEVTATLTHGGYVFPVFGPASFGDTFGAPRGDVSGGWHHGEDIFAPLGAPLLAVANGTVFSVGWNDIGGWRLWLRDDSGNEFYYAHLSAYSPLAVEGNRVRAGAVLGFMGRTGDADGGLVHLHFEIHPAALLARGYDGAVAPYPFLIAWRRAEDVAFGSGRSFVADGASGLPVASAHAGAVLLEANDISGTSGLVPGGLERALARGKPRSTP